MYEFFYRFEGLNLVAGNKSAGFAMHLEPAAFKRLHDAKVSPNEQDRVNQMARVRLVRAGLVGKRLAGASGIVFFEDTACPRYFMTDPVFGASIGCDPETFSRVQRKDLLEWLGPCVTYTPHNTDTPKQALSLLLLAQTWTEWASTQLYRQEVRPTGA